MPDIDDIWDDDEDLRICTTSFEHDAVEIPDEYEVAKAALDAAILTFTRKSSAAHVYMPSLATYLRIKADELADRYPDDTNGGRFSIGGVLT